MKKFFVILASVGIAVRQLSAFVFLFTAHSPAMVGIADDSGKILWSTTASHPQRADVSADGKCVFVAELHGARMIDIATKKTLWEYKCPQVKWKGEESKDSKRGELVRLQNPVAQILGNGRFLVGNEGRSALLEIDEKGKMHKEIIAESPKKVAHGEFRLASKTDHGTYIFPMLASGMILEYSADAKTLVNKIKTPAGAVGAVRLKSGNLFSAGVYGLAAYSDGKAYWTFTADELRKECNAKSPLVICDAKPLDDDSFLCSVYSDKNQPDIILVSVSQKKVLKKIDFPKISAFSAVEILDKNFRPLRTR